MVGYYKPFHTEATAFSAASKMLTCLGIVLCLLAVSTGGIFTFFAVTDLLMALGYHKFSNSLNKIHIRFLDGFLTYKDRNERHAHVLSTEDLSYIYISKGLKNNTFLIFSHSFLTAEHQRSIAVQGSAKRRLLIDDCIAIKIDQTPASHEFVDKVQ